MPGPRGFRLSRLLLLVAAISLVNCGDPAEPKVDQRASSIDVGPDTAVVQSGATTQLTTTIRTKSDEVLTGLTVAFASSDTNIAAVDASGVVTGKKAGKATITATYNGLKSTALVQVTAGTAANIARVNDAPVNPAVGSSASLSVRVTDAAGNLVPDAAVDFTVTAGNGSVNPATAITNASGVATTSFTVSSTIGANTVTANIAGGTPVSFNANSVAGPASIVTKLTTDPTGIVAGDKYGEIRVRVTDAFGNPRPNETVFFSAASGSSVSPTGALTNADGEAASQFTTSKVVGLNTATAKISLATSTPATFTTTTVPGPSVKVKANPVLMTIGVGSTATVTASTADVNDNLTVGALSYVSRTPGVATVSAAGVVTGVAEGQTFVVASGPLGVDSVLVAIRGVDSPILIAEPPGFAVTANTDIPLTIYVDMTAAGQKLGSTTIKIEWDPTVTSYRLNQAITGGPTPTVNATQTATGALTFTLSDAAGFSGKVAVLKLTLRAATTVGKSGTIRLSASELTSAGTFVDLLPKTAVVTIPIITR